MDAFFLYPLALLFSYMTFWYVISLELKRMDVADVAWGLGFVLISALTFIMSAEVTLRKALVFFLVFVWGVRLALHIGSRMKGKKEDKRYQAFREDWGQLFALRSFIEVFMIQGVLLYIIALPLMVVNAFDVSSVLGYTGMFGLGLWILGFFFESVGDYQLRMFIKNPENAGRIMTKGLWKYTRHPNYFGEICMWWGIWFLVLPVPYGLFSIIGPITITFLLTKVSGVPMMEKHYEGNEEYVAYKMKTNTLIPWFSK